MKMLAFAHLMNIFIHASAGVAALCIGFYLLVKTKGTAAHRKFGKVFGVLGLMVCVAAALGLAVFRFLPLFAVITLLVLYQLISGWRVIYTKEMGPAKCDAFLTLGTALAAFFMAPSAMHSAAGQPIILYSSFGALMCVLVYDAARWVFPRHWHKRAWRYEHSYKLLAALFGMLSAFVGNTVRFGQPWSQILPSVLGLFCIGYFFYALYRAERP